MDIRKTNKLIPTMISLLVAAQGAHAHMIMANPVPYGYETIDNSPLTSSNYPCKVTSDPATFYSTSGIDNTYAAGNTQTLSFKGSAVHGGGSCQLAITNDMQPSTDTDWRVILSIESGCPSKDGTNVGTYNWTVPEDLAAGQYSFAWTWISKLAGQPEYYMNCAPITVTTSDSSSKKRSSESDYPELFVANLDSINSCKTSPGTDVVYPDPGPNVEKLLNGATPSFATISQAGCVPKSQSQGSSSLPTATAGGSGDGDAASSSGSSSAVTTSASAVATGGIFFTTATTGVSSTGTTLVTSTSTAGGDAATITSSSTSTDLSVYVSPVVQTSFPSSEVATSSSVAASSSSSSSSSSSASFATGGGSGSGATATTASSASSASSAAVSTTTTAAVTTSSSSASTATATATATGSGNNSTSSGSSGASTKSGTCTDEGTFNCVGDQYQQCASGAWTSMQSLPAGTTCQQGESTTLWARGVSGLFSSRVNVNLLRRMRRGGAGTGVVGLGHGS